jgi:hypothetical protein
VDDDARGVAEVSRRWLRGRDASAEYVQQPLPAIENLNSQLGDVQETAWNDVGLVTCWLEQDHTYQGQSQHVSSHLRRVSPVGRAVARRHAAHDPPARADAVA